MSLDDNKEYFALLDTVAEFDRRLLTVKGWGVTLSLVVLGFGFLYRHYGLFLVAAVSGFAFWAIEGQMKRHQMRFYFRMREIEVLLFEQSKNSKSQIITPQIDWAWYLAPKYYNGKEEGEPQDPKRYSRNQAYRYVWLFPHVCLPHLISVAVGGALFVFGLQGELGMPL